jgi:intracellular multiplication protein IcmB
MSVATGVFDFTSGLLAFYDLLSKKKASAYVRLETADDIETLVADDGSLVSVIRLHGCRRLLNQQGIFEMADAMATDLSSYLSRPGHALQFYFSRDASRGRREVVKSLRPARLAARELNLDVGDLLEEREDLLAQWIVGEEVVVVCWTRPSVMSKIDLKEQRDRVKQDAEAAPIMRDAQWLVDPSADMIRTRHGALVKSLRYHLHALGLDVDVMDRWEIVKFIRRELFPDINSEKWKPLFPGDKVPARLSQRLFRGDVSDVLWPALRHQLFPAEPERLDGQVCRFGNTLFSSVDMSVPPEVIKPFQEFLTAMQQADDTCPFRASILVEGAGIQALGAIKLALSSTLGWLGETNKRLHRAIKEVQERSLNGEAICRLRLSFATWAPVGEEKLLRQRNAILRRAVESWGNASADDKCGDALEGVLSSAPALHCMSTAPSAAAPITELTCMLPISRIGSPFHEGGTLFRTPDGRPWPYQPGSSLSDTWVTLVFAPPGKGKSVLINGLNLATVFSPPMAGAGSAKLSRIAILDIGPSSSGLVSLLQDALPEDQRHEVLYKRLLMKPEHAINPFDTPLGCRRPPPTQKSWLVNFLLLLCSEMDTGIYDGAPDLINAAVDEVYNMLDDGKDIEPRVYHRGIDPIVDETLETNAIRLPADRPLWWEVVDALYEAGYIRAALRAQRYAVPLMSDLPVAMRTERIRDIFCVEGRETRVASTGEILIDALMRKLSSAVSEFSILTRPTAFELGHARVVSLDLQEVAPKGGGKADHQTAVMYMLGLHVLAQDFFMSMDDLELFPHMYRAHHQAHIRSLKEAPKRLVMDEFHRTSGAIRGVNPVREQVVRYIREGRKHGVQICLASQLLADFDGQMVEQATEIFILGAGEGSGADAVAKTFDLTPVEQQVVRSRLTGPGSGGAPFLAIMALNTGRYRHYLFNTMGPVELWALGTHAVDVELRRRLYDRIGSGPARRVLAARFPSGSVRRYIESEMAKAGDDLTVDERENMIDTLARELVEESLRMSAGGARRQ